MLKISYAGYLGLSPTTLSQFTVEMCTALQPKIAKKFTNPLFLGGSRSFEVIDADKSIKPITSACYDMQHV